MSIEREDVEKIARLAKLKVSGVVIEQTTQELSNILGFIDQLQAVDTQNIEPMAHPTDATQKLRADVVTESDNRASFQAIAPASEDGLYLVPKVIE
ncbi:Asp-tRNA(Asn)/Glu-tRNA(Gln) amidotransferase subunit GatC [Oleiphilus messinensis]|uniref:Asp-tRNA(Asn)/Glu-tRNA(Gln) amidotransferase subunit GatC n=1 Tax=Oleiphilus messinensis TaxID=141451 RepID=UPI000B3B25F3|nr:Asp-tRNA(Asn)/Glu-tRNA(Gln) amidotransferase subunit GatC [Oleiphilus messinensis]